ncbi:hypothetical protein HRG84_17820 [Flavisolibacter sp. BT320]|nr:hypothetical protein [Flavisolibacter longurius]
MIPSCELRLGNYVLVDQNIEQVAMINGTFSATTALADGIESRDDITKSHRLEMLQPVPLTDAVLKQCNFVYHDYFKFWQLIAGTDADRSEMDNDKDYTVIDFMRRPVVKKLTSLHQLQNIYFMLKGKELVFQNKS